MSVVQPASVRHESVVRVPGQETDEGEDVNETLVLFGQETIMRNKTSRSRVEVGSNLSETRPRPELFPADIFRWMFNFV